MIIVWGLFILGVVFLWVGLIVYKEYYDKKDNEGSWIAIKMIAVTILVILSSAQYIWG